MGRLLTESDRAAKSARNRKAWGVKNSQGGVKLPLPAPLDGSEQAERARKPSGKRSKPRQRVLTEHMEQCAVIDWWNASCASYGLDYRLLASIPNGSHKSMATAAKFKREGLRAGWPDLMLATHSRAYPGGRNAGLFIELKRHGWKPPKSGIAAQHWQRQADIHDLLRAQGYQVNVCVGAESAIATIREYLK